MDDGDIDPLQKKRLFRRRQERAMLNEWYGPAYAARESSAWGMPARPAADFLEAATRQVFSPETGMQMQLDAHWPEIVGETLAAMSRVGGLENGVLTLEVRHSVYRKELENASDLILALANRHLGSAGCRELRLTAANRRSRKFHDKSQATS